MCNVVRTVVCSEVYISTNVVAFRKQGSLGTVETRLTTVWPRADSDSFLPNPTQFIHPSLQNSTPCNLHVHSVEK
jgi:hypothetical protein